MEKYDKTRILQENAFPRANSSRIDAIAPEHIKALALDLDGTTLCPDGSLSERTIRVLKTCLNQGIKVIFCTGRCVTSVEPYRLAIGTEGPMVYFNGAAVIAMPSRLQLSGSLLDLDVVDYCIDLSRRMGVYYQIFFSEAGGETFQEVLMAENQTAETEMYYKHTGIQATIGDLKKVLATPGLKGCIKSMFISDPSFHEPIRSQLRERFGDRIYIAKTLQTFLEVMDAKVSKGQGLKLVLEHYGFQNTQVIAFGDEENDLPMFSAAGLAAAPVNAKEQVRAAADITIGSNREEGVAQFLEDFFKL